MFQVHAQSNLLQFSLHSFQQTKIKESLDYKKYQLSKVYKMLATKIFPQTFRNFQQMVGRNLMVQQKVLNKTKNPFTQFHISNLYSISNLISLQLAQLQKSYVIELLDSFNFKQKVFESEINKKIASEISYDEDRHFFSLKFNYQMRKTLPLLQSMQQIKEYQLRLQKQNQQQQFQNLQVQIKIRNCQNQQIDHPSVRHTLYFHQLKDIEKYVTFKPLAKTPLFLVDMHKKKMEMTVLDQKNPYGFPLKAPPLIFDIQLSNKVYFTVKSTYQQTNIIEVGSLKRRHNRNNNNSEKSFRTNAMKIPRTVQEIIYNNIVSQLLMIDDPELLRLHKLAYIGGKVQKLNTLMHVHETMAMDHEDLFHMAIA